MLLSSPQCDQVGQHCTQLGALHICNKYEAFKTYTLIEDLSIAGVGQLKAHVKGCGTVQLQSLYKGCIIILKLTNVLYVLENQHNLLLLSRWDQDGHCYIGHQGQLTLFTKEGRGVVCGIKITNNLYKMQLKYMPKLQLLNTPLPLPNHPRVGRHGTSVLAT